MSFLEDQVKSETPKVKLNPNAQTFTPKSLKTLNASAKPFYSSQKAPPSGNGVPLLTGFQYPKDYVPKALPYPTLEQPPPHMLIPSHFDVAQQQQQQPYLQPFDSRLDYTNTYNGVKPVLSPEHFITPVTSPSHNVGPRRSATMFAPSTPQAAFAPPPPPPPVRNEPMPFTNTAEADGGKLLPTAAAGPSVAPPPPPFLASHASMGAVQPPSAGFSARMPQPSPPPPAPAHASPRPPAERPADRQPAPQAPTPAPPSRRAFDAAALTDAPAYVPSPWRPPHPPRESPGSSLRQEAGMPAAGLSSENPIVVLIYGCRGVGKSTQSQILAERYHLLWLSSGNLLREGRMPFEELRRIAGEQFGPNGARGYNGLVLDRFIVTSEIDAYYIETILREANLPTPLVFWLQVDPRVGMERAKSRGEVKPALEHWRQVEKVAQEAAAEKVYRPCGRLVVVDCNKLDKEASSAVIIRAVENFISGSNRHAVELPPFSPLNTSVPLPAIVKHDVFEQLRNGIHKTVENTTGRTDTPPLCLVGGYVDSKFFQASRKNNRFVSHFINVTLKVDGQRFLVARHREYGFVGFPFIFNYCLDFNALFAGSDLSRDSSLDTPFDVILDTELQEDCQGKTMLHIIDFVYLHGHQAKLISFLDRYQMLKEWIPESYHYPVCMENPQNFCLKQYVPISKLHSILDRLENAPFPVDGIVFQHNEVYRFGVDRYMLKWKPKEMCTVDFRLNKGKISESGESWEFKLYVTDSVPKCQDSWQEVLFPNAIGIFTSREMEENQLCEGKIVELFLNKIQRENRKTQDSNSVDHTVWTFHRVRNDKPGPNKFTTVKQIVELEHLNYEELIRETKAVRYVEPLKSFHSTDKKKALNGEAHISKNGTSS